jgi:hypothetical protein
MRAEAALLARARRPSTSMWAVNQMVRRRPELVDALLERSEQLRGAQSSGDREATRDAIRGHRAALVAAGEAAVEVLGPRGNDTFREEILSVLRAASTQADLGEALRAGRLVRPDDLLPGFTEVADDAPRSPDPQTRATNQDADRARAEAERATRQKLDDALREEMSADAAVAAAQGRVDDLSEQLANAREELRDARSRARKAGAESARLRKQLDRPAR